MYFMYVHFDMNFGGDTADRRANIAYTCVNALYFAVYAFIFLYLSMYMLDNGFNNSEIGLMMASGFIISVFLQQVIANFADKAKKISVSQILAAGFLLIIGINTALLFLHGRTMLIPVLYCGQITTIMSVQPCLNAMNFQMQNCHYKMNYGIARSMGSLAYAVISAILGQILTGLGNSVLQYGAILLSAVLIALLLAMDFKLRARARLLAAKAPAPSRGAVPAQKVSYLGFIKKYRAFMLFIFGSIFFYYSYATLNNYLYQVMVPLGATKAQYGNVQGFKAAIELLPMILSLSLTIKFGLRRLLILSSVGFVLKSLFTLLAGSIGQIYFATCFQIISYGLYAPLTVYYVAELFERHDAVKGQSLITMGYAIGCVIASLAGGLVLNSFGPRVLLVLSTAACVIGTVIVTLSLSVIEKRIPKRNPIFKTNS